MKKIYKNIKLGVIFIACLLLQNQHNAISQNGDIQKLPLHAIILNQNYTPEQKVQVMQDALERKIVGIDIQDADGRTALNLATFYKAEPLIIDFLLQSGANVNLSDRFNVTPLHNAIEFEEIENIKMLLAAGADQNWKNDKGQTPVDLARSDKVIKLFGAQAETTAYLSRLANIKSILGFTTK